MFQINPEASLIGIVLVWLAIFTGLFVLNEATRRSKYFGFFMFFIFPFIMVAIWATVLRDSFYDTWFHISKFIAVVVACVGLWFIRYYSRVDKVTGKEWRVINTKFAKIFPPLILAINILQAVIRDIQLGLTHSGAPPTFDADSGAYVLGGVWNFMNAGAGIFSIVTLTGFVGICLKKDTGNDKSKTMLWPDMLWFYVIAYTFWNFAYLYNALPHRAWYSGLALLLAPAICSFTVGKGAWGQHRAHTLMLWLFFALTFPNFLDDSIWRVNSTYNPTIYFIVSFIALASNFAVFAYVLYRWKVTGNNPYTGEVFADHKESQRIKALAE